jgi:hypothetical protein
MAHSSVLLLVLLAGNGLYARLVTLVDSTLTRPRSSYRDSLRTADAANAITGQDCGISCSQQLSTLHPAGTWHRVHASRALHAELAQHQDQLQRFALVASLSVHADYCNHSMQSGSLQAFADNELTCSCRQAEATVVTLSTMGEGVGPRRQAQQQMCPPVCFAGVTCYSQHWDSSCQCCKPGDPDKPPPPGAKPRPPR